MCLGKLTVTGSGRAPRSAIEDVMSEGRGHCGVPLLGGCVTPSLEVEGRCVSVKSQRASSPLHCWLLSSQLRCSFPRRLSPPGTPCPSRPGSSVRCFRRTAALATQALSSSFSGTAVAMATIFLSVAAPAAPQSVAATGGHQLCARCCTRGSQ